ncbi:ATP-dependent helicase [Bombiscardovia coagulans]|uniref:DNA 3'-5' helicase n=1 Tax=Bombiscardovia coagulans TaxID=686666 RepID=A0A261EPC6_9BIFI|nr:ATP-dependent helicase [Bombiscardovia coagulans]OZG48705.1 DNA helicase II [Bombiscardovia coagulans]
MSERKTTDDLLEGLDASQHTAAVTVDGPVRIIAGAGAGKTRTITHRIAYACACQAWDPSRTLAVTFSVKAAGELRSRLTKLGVSEEVTAATFHSAALHQLRRVWADITDAYFPQVAEDLRPFMARAFQRVTGLDDPDPIQLRDLLDEVNWTKVSLIAPEEYSRVCAATHRNPPAALETSKMADVIEAFETEKTAHGAIDFNDILLMTCHVLEEFEEAAQKIRQQVGWLTVDEYQDVSPLQHRLMELWLNKQSSVCVVGDPAQTIYSFAGASSYYLLDFDHEFAPVSADIQLNTDYRSTPQVVSYANRILSASPERADYLKLSSPKEDGPRVNCMRYPSDMDEAQGVVRRIERLLSRGAQPGQCAILTRINAQQKIMCTALKQAGIHYRVRTDNGWQRSISAAELSQLDSTELIATLRGEGEGLVTVSTIHAAKGLEFNHVFLVGCSEGLLPFGSPQSGAALEEERRLMYVAVTRASESLHISFADRKDGTGGGQRSPSRFV